MMRANTLDCPCDNTAPNQSLNSKRIPIVDDDSGLNRKDLPQHAHDGQLAFLEKHKPADANLHGSFVGGRGKQFVQNDYAQ